MALQWQSVEPYVLRSAWLRTFGYQLFCQLLMCLSLCIACETSERNNVSLSAWNIEMYGVLVAQQCKLAYVPIQGIARLPLPVSGSRPTKAPPRPACRARIWGSAGMPRALMADKDCWLQLMALDPVTGVDPEGTRLRAHEGLDGVDFFVPVPPPPFKPTLFPPPVNPSRSCAEPPCTESDAGAWPLCVRGQGQGRRALQGLGADAPGGDATEARGAR